MTAHFFSHSPYMQEAIQLAEKGRLTAPPNPWVGCILVKDGQIVGRGYHAAPGLPHAEVHALHQAQEAAKGAAAYVSLEPCSHFGRTPPCADALIRAGIKEVFVALEDPDPRVKGQGIAKLRQAGIKVHVGVCEQEAKASLTPYLHHRKTGLPYTIIKSAMSLDGRTAAADGTSQWISSLEARQDAHRQRAYSQAIIVGSKTAQYDQPLLTVSHPLLAVEKQPLRVVLDARGTVLPQGPLFDLTLAPTLVITTEKAPSSMIDQWQKTGAEVATVPASEQGVDLLSTWKLLGQKGVLQAFVEGGSTLQTSLLQTDLFNLLSLYIGPLILGDKGHPLFSYSVDSLNQALRMQLKNCCQFGDCLRLDYEPYST
jgi:diaminohydroxyphosphoribosylaminopyrimidine deaminase / 5-amino-6-(5-phosphoribosylamino)uracil reductase